ncbi:MAG: hypothetical protein GKS02_10285 [Alphaproteobacteria bacterium]|nr:hypothetical protein [Alphaproteobacteria bacterium]
MIMLAGIPVTTNLRVVLGVSVFLSSLLAFAELAPAMAQQTSAPGGGGGLLQSFYSIWGDLMQYVRTQQRAFTNELAGAVRSLRDEDSLAAAWGLVVVSFLYGVFHAAGPGHGKVVISTYLLTHPSNLKRGLALAWVSSLVQGVTAVVLVMALVHLFGLALRETRNAVGPLETTSFALVALLGGWLVWRAIAAIRRSFLAHGQSAIAGNLHNDHIGHAHDPNDPNCCVAHGPSAQQIGAIKTWREALPIVLSIGIRPCSGGVLVLLIAEAMDLRAAGIGAVFAMAIGTALTVSALALSSVFLRKFATMVVRSEGTTVQAAGHVVALAGGGIIMMLGLALFFDSLKPSAVPVF